MTIKIDVDDPEHTWLKDMLNELQHEYLYQIGNRMIENIEDEIERDIFLSRTGIPVEGIVDLGDYLESFDFFVYDLPNQKKLEVGSTEEKALDIEQGMDAGRVASEVKEADIIAWVTRKDIPYDRSKIKSKNIKKRKLRVAQRIYRSMLRHGIQPKPAMQIAIDRTIGDNNEIINRTLQEMAKKHPS